MSPGPRPTQHHLRNALIRFGLLSLVVVTLVGAGSYVLLEKISYDQATADAAGAGRGMTAGLVAPYAKTVESVISEGPVLTQDSRATIARLMMPRMKDGSVLRYKVWNADGRILLSDEERLIGRRFDLDPQDAALLRNGGTSAAFTPLTDEENVLDQHLVSAEGEVLEVYAGFMAADRTPLLFEAYLPAERWQARRAELLGQVFPVAVGGPALLFLVMLPLAWSMTRRLESVEQERNAYLHDALTAADRERSRIVQRLHDVVIPELAALGYVFDSLLPDVPEQRRTELAVSRDVLRADLAFLRQLLGEVHGPSITQGHELKWAVETLVEVSAAHGVRTSTTLTGLDMLPTREAQMCFDLIREALRNVERHARATAVEVAVRVEQTRVKVSVQDNGIGFDLAAVDTASHLGLRLLEARVKEAGGILSIQSDSRSGTKVAAELPLSREPGVETPSEGHAARVGHGR